MVVNIVCALLALFALHQWRRSVRAHKRAEEQLVRANLQKLLILESAGEGIYGVDLEGRVTFVNSTATQIFGWENKDLAGCRVHDLGVSKNIDGSPLPWTESDTYKVLTEGVTISGPAILERKDHVVRDMEFTCKPMREASGAVVGAVVTFRDVTDRLALERMKNEFVSLVSHELRTPLTAIRGALGLIVSGRMGELPAKVGRMMEIAVTNTDRLIRLINDILDIERIESGTIALEKRACTARELIDASVDAVAALVEKAGVRIERRDCDVTLTADPDRLIQTLTNLLGNAIKFSPAGTTVTISAFADEQQAGFSVEDQGRGIPADKLESIFERFQQVDASDSRDKGGSGLGLAICRTIVRQHDGEIRVESEPGRGSRFSFTVPVAA